MIPIVFIIAFGLVGFFIWGLKGLLSGFICGYLLALIIGYVAKSSSGGLLPRKIRKNVATNFINSHSNITKEVYPNVGGEELSKAIEKDVETIFQKSVEEFGSLGGQEYGWRREDIKNATDLLVKEAPSNERKDFLIALENQIEEDIYP